MSASAFTEFYKAIGQFSFYLTTMEMQEPDRVLYLAIPKTAYEYLFQDPIVEQVAKNNKLRLIIYSVKEKNIVLWKR